MDMLIWLMGARASMRPMAIVMVMVTVNTRKMRELNIINGIPRSCILVIIRLDFQCVRASIKSRLTTP